MCLLDYHTNKQIPAVLLILMAISLARNVPVIRGSALNALENDDFHAIKSLLEKLDAFADADRKTVKN